MQRVPGPFHGYVVLEDPKILEYERAMLALVLETQNRTHFSAGQQQDFHLVIGKDLIGTHAFLEGIFVFGLVLLAFGGHAPAMQGSYFSLVVELKTKRRARSAFRAQNFADQPPMSDNIAIVFDCSFPVIQQNHGVSVIGVMLGWLLGQAAHPIRGPAAGRRWPEH